jgi:molecular chaperone GrpE
LNKIKIKDDSDQPEEAGSEEEHPNKAKEEDPEARLQEKVKEAGENYDKYLRVSAEFENFKKRAEKENIETGKFANERLVKDLIPVLDNLDRAIEHGRETENIKTLLEGVEMTYKGFLTVLEKFGVKPIEALGAEFDPNLHEAVMVQQDADQPPGRVLTQIQRGYQLHNRLVRPAMVVVSTSPELTAEEESEAGTA